MTPYLNLGGTSNVHSYQINSDNIVIQFHGTPSPYTYSERRAGKFHVDRMKELAVAGQGLNSYVMTNVKDRYDQ